MAAPKHEFRQVKRTTSKQTLESDEDVFRVVSRCGERRARRIFRRNAKHIIPAIGGRDLGFVVCTLSARVK